MARLTIGNLSRETGVKATTTSASKLWTFSRETVEKNEPVVSASASAVSRLKCRIVSMDVAVSASMYASNGFMPATLKHRRLRKNPPCGIRIRDPVDNRQNACSKG